VDAKKKGAKRPFKGSELRFFISSFLKPDGPGKETHRLKVVV
jgi:hypothetical protein